MVIKFQHLKYKFKKSLQKISNKKQILKEEMKWDVI